jgi:NAD(P)H-dependent FMN reductase
MKKNIFAVIGSASKESSNLKLVQKIKTLTHPYFAVEIFDGLHQLPHFDPALSVNDTPPEVIHFRNKILGADGIIFCTPEYIFSIPSALKNAIEWCVSTTVFSKKPVGIITASASGVKGHEELKMILKTIEAFFTEDTTLLIHGIRAKVDNAGDIIDAATMEAIRKFIDAFKVLVNQNDFD